jgi:hypothetical protein
MIETDQVFAAVVDKAWQHGQVVPVEVRRLQHPPNHHTSLIIL